MQGPEPNSTPLSKHELRSSLRQRRAALAPAPGSTTAAELNQALAAHVDAELRSAGARSIAVYVALRDEIDPSGIAALARARGCQVSYPRIADSQPPRLSFHLCGEAELLAGTLGIREPSAEAPVPAVIEAFVVPGLGFDRRGARLGYGKGFYDAALRQQPAALRIAVGYDFQVLPTIPQGEQDEPVDLVVTPSGPWRTGARPLLASPAKKESP